jgi:hypothetical protein
LLKVNIMSVNEMTVEEINEVSGASSGGDFLIGFGAGEAAAGGGIAGIGTIVPEPLSPILVAVGASMAIQGGLAVGIGSIVNLFG